MDADIALFEKVKKGNIASFEKIFEKYYLQLCGYCNKFVRDHETAQEIVSDVFAYIWSKRREINLKSNLRSYLFRSVKNLSLTKLRSSKIPSEELNESILNSLRETEGADHNILYTEFSARLEEIIKQMPKQRQLVFRMSRLEGLSYNEIAIAMSISPRTVQNHMVEAVKYMSSYRQDLMNLITTVALLCISLVIAYY
ncbi:RNA polymerase sigma-70 factor [Reichenbachiella sp. MALMAid0571]|uniref:RNA polymerase sigma-70 factor n=1 Tax=Reichenbachiella sp. MALMAid0571 TaxID=3143939 RepID=UPI0032DE4407